MPTPVQSVYACVAACGGTLCLHAVLEATGTQPPLRRPRPSLPAGAKQAEEVLGPGALELVALYDQLCIVRFLHERMPEAADAGARAPMGRTLRGALGGRRREPACCQGSRQAGDRCPCGTCRADRDAPPVPTGGLPPLAPLPAAQQALDILKQHDEGFGPASAIAATRLASTLLATGAPQEAQVGTWGGLGRGAGRRRQDAWKKPSCR